MLKLLTSLGLSRKNAELYLFIAVNGPIQVKAIADGMAVGRQQAYRRARQLQKRKVVITSNTHPMTISAVDFQQAIDILSKPRRNAIQALETNRDEILSHWQLVTDKP